MGEVRFHEIAIDMVSSGGAIFPPSLQRTTPPPGATLSTSGMDCSGIELLSPQ